MISGLSPEVEKDFLSMTSDDNLSYEESLYNYTYHLATKFPSQKCMIQVFDFKHDVIELEQLCGVLHYMLRERTFIR